MAIENVVALLQASQKNPELMAKLEAVNSSEQVVEIGAGEGLEFTTEEAEAFRQKLIEIAQKAEDGELTEEELETAAGGNALKTAVGSMYGSAFGVVIGGTLGAGLGVASKAVGANNSIGETTKVGVVLGGWIGSDVGKSIANSRIFSGW